MTSVDGVIKKFIFLKKEHFLEWPITFQRLVLIFLLLLFLIILNAIFFSDKNELITINQAQIKNLQNLLQDQKNLIDKVNYYSIGETEKNLYGLNFNLAYFMQYFSNLSKKNYLQIQSIKPLPSRGVDNQQEMLEITALGEYHNLIVFLSDISVVSVPAAINDFEIIRQGNYKEKLVLNVSLNNEYLKTRENRE